MILSNLCFLVAFPLGVALVLLGISGNSLRNWIVRLSALIIGASVLGLIWFSDGGMPTVFEGKVPWLTPATFGIEILITAFIVVVSARAKQFLILALAILQFGIMTYLELNHGSAVIPENNFYLDQFSLIMAAIIGIIGTLICVYALGYMKDFHHHHGEIQDRRKLFFFVLFVFLSAMFGIVFSNNLYLLFFFWEVTTLCSFLLIGYTKTPEATRNAFRALVMNLAGGLCFALALLYLHYNGQTVELDKLVANKNVALLPVALLCIAGITKSAQMPFSSWLLGAMVAPTPTSALLHSSTMVKAGVFLILKLSPLLEGNGVGMMVALIGGFTFLLASLINIGERNAKKVLAYSTIANLGLIVACGGVGTHQTVWIGIFLIIFHAVSKSLLFLTVGTAEHRLHSRDIENMDNLLVKLPILTILFTIGIATMFLAPFGIVVSKWAAIEAFVSIDSILSPILILIIAFGSAATVFYWTKLLGKLIAINQPVMKDRPLEKQISNDEWFSEWTHAVLAVIVCLTYPWLSLVSVEPYLQTIYGQAFTMSSGNVLIMTIMLSMILVLPIVMIVLWRGRPFTYLNAYVSGRNIFPGLKTEGAMGIPRDIALKNYYLEEYFPENKLAFAGVLLCSITLLVMVALGVL